MYAPENQNTDACICLQCSRQTIPLVKKEADRT